MRRVAFAVAGLLALTVSGSALSQEAPCRAQWRVASGQTTANGSLEAIAGRACRLPIQMGGQSALTGIRIARQAANGVATAQGGSITYQPRGAFKGSDSFVMEISWTNNAGPQRANVTFAVTVP